MPTRYTTASFQRTSTGNIVTSVSGESIYVCTYAIAAGGATLVQWQDEDGTALSGGIVMGTTPWTFSGSRDAYAFVVTKNKSLRLFTSAATTVGGHVSYYTI